MKFHSNFIDKCMDKNPKFFGKLIKLVKKNSKTVNIYEMISPNLKFKNIHSGKRCFILGNGPSINEQNLDVLENEFVFTVNQISKNKSFSKIKPNYHFWADPVFFDIDLEMQKNIELYETMKNINTEENNPHCFYPKIAYDMITKTKLDKDLDISYFQSASEMDKFICDEREIDFIKFVPSFHTVVQYAIAMAIYMGFTEINFLGCEMTNILTFINTRINNSSRNDYCYCLSEAEQKRISEASKLVSYEKEIYSHYRVMRDYRLLAEYCEKRGIILRNCTPGGLVEGVKRQKYEDLFKK